MILKKMSKTNKKGFDRAMNPHDGSRRRLNSVKHEKKDFGRFTINELNKMIQNGDIDIDDVSDFLNKTNKYD